MLACSVACSFGLFQLQCDFVFSSVLLFPALLQIAVVSVFSRMLGSHCIWWIDLVLALFFLCALVILISWSTSASFWRGNQVDGLPRRHTYVHAEPHSCAAVSSAAHNTIRARMMSGFWTG